MNGPLLHVEEYLLARHIEFDPHDFNLVLKVQHDVSIPITIVENDEDGFVDAQAAIYICRDRVRYFVEFINLIHDVLDDGYQVGYDFDTNEVRIVLTFDHDDVAQEMEKFIWQVNECLLPLLLKVGHTGTWDEPLLNRAFDQLGYED